MIHFINENKKSAFIIAKTECGKDWQDVRDFSSNKEYVTCKNCAKKINYD